MRIQFLTAAAVLLAGCSGQGVQTGPVAAGLSADAGQPEARRMEVTAAAPAPAPMAGLPDLGSLLAYDRVRAPIRQGPYTWHPVRLSEEHAIRAVVGSDLVLTAPDGRPIRLQYHRHVEHPDGNWTWIGRSPGAEAGQEAILTFGRDAVFGTVPNGDAPPLRVATRGRQAWLVETDPVALGNLAPRSREPDFRLPPRAAGSASMKGATAASAPAQVAATATTTVDLLLGYTTGYASGLGGSSHAITRLTNLVEITNQAYANSQVDARLRLVGTLQVGYTDASANDDALYELTGVECSDQPGGGMSCSFVDPAASLQPLHAAREQLGADLVSLVRDFQDPEHEGCGIAWLNGGGQVPITSDDAVSGFSVVSDGSDGSFFCRDETLAHELGHNMGSAHDLDTAEGEDGALQANEYGRYPYSFGYKPAGFYTIMAYGDTDQQAYRVFSNPQITSCGGQACGIANQADNARSLRQTMPVAATFRQSVFDPGVKRDFNGDGRSDVLWRNSGTGANTIWLSANAATQQAMASSNVAAWKIAGTGDFDGDGRTDVLWRHGGDGRNLVWRSADSSTLQWLTGVTNQAWFVAGIDDFNGDGRSDILWRNSANGSNVIWLSGNSATQQSMAASTLAAWKIAGIGDFNGDGQADVLWRNGTDGRNLVWESGNSASLRWLAPVTNLRWFVAGVADFNGDGRSDILWRNPASGVNAIWLSGNASTPQTMASSTIAAWVIAATDDFDGDGRADVLWRNNNDGRNVIWRSANQATLQWPASMPLAWKIVQ